MVGHGTVSATGRPPTVRALRRPGGAAAGRRPGDAPRARLSAPGRPAPRGLEPPARRGCLRVRSEPGLVERAVELVEKVADVDVSEVAETVAEKTEAVQGAIIETGAAAVGVAAAFNSKIFSALSGPVRAMILLNLGSALFGSNQVALKMAEESMSSDAISAIRFILAAAVFAPGIVRGLRMPKLRRSGIELGVWLFGGYILQAVGLESTTAAHGSFTATIMVLVVPLLVGLSGRRVPTTTWVASLVALFGVGLLTTSDAAPNVGDGLCVLSAVLFGVQKWRSEGATQAFAQHTGELVAVQLGTLAAAATLFEAPHIVGTLTTQSPGEIYASLAGLPWGLLLYMGLATTAFTLWVEINALKDVPAPLAALIYTSEPLWGALFAWTLLGEHWGPTGWVGAFLVVSASLAAQLNGAQAQEEAAADAAAEISGEAEASERETVNVGASYDNGGK